TEALDYFARERAVCIRGDLHERLRLAGMIVDGLPDADRGIRGRGLGMHWRDEAKDCRDHAQQPGGICDAQGARAAKILAVLLDECLSLVVSIRRFCVAGFDSRP